MVRMRVGITKGRGRAPSFLPSFWFVLSSPLQLLPLSYAPVSLRVVFTYINKELTGRSDYFVSQSQEEECWTRPFRGRRASSFLWTREFFSSLLVFISPRAFEVYTFTLAD